MLFQKKKKKHIELSLKGSLRNQKWFYDITEKNFLDIIIYFFFTLG